MGIEDHFRQTFPLGEEWKDKIKAIRPSRISVEFESEHEIHFDCDTGSDRPSDGPELINVAPVPEPDE